MDLSVKWNELIENPVFQNLPYKVELNKFGQILATPHSNQKGALKAEIGIEINKSVLAGKGICNCSILTNEGVRVADVAWASDEFIEEFGDVTPFPKAPEICVEIKSPANSKAEMEEKIRLYLEKGAQEVWIVDLNRKAEFHSHIGKIKKSKLVRNFSL